MAEGATPYTNTGTGLVDAVGVTAGATLTAGTAARQLIGIADGAGAANFALVDTAGNANSTAKKTFYVLTTTALAATAVFTSAWMDTALDDAMYVEAQGISNVAGSGTAANYTRIEETSNTANTALFTTVSTISAAVGASVPWALKAQISQRYWRLVYTNSATAQTTFEVNAVSVGDINPYLSNADTRNSIGVNLFGLNSTTPAGIVVQADGAASVNGLNVNSLLVAYNGVTFDRAHVVPGSGELSVSTGGHLQFLATVTNGAAAQLVKGSKGSVRRIHVPSTQAAAVVVTVNDVATTAGVAATNVVFSKSFNPGDSIDVSTVCTLGVVLTLSAAPSTNPVYIGYA